MSDRDYVGLARQYEDAVIAGTIPACKWVRLACQRNRRDRERAEANDSTFPYQFNIKRASAICKAAESLPHIKGPKAKVIGQDEEGRSVWAKIALEPWQCWFFTTLFGWLHRDTQLRRFRVALLLTPRKSGKSSVGAVIVLYMLTADGESGPECYSAATTRDQAKVVAEIAWEMARRSPEFRDYFGVKVGAETTKRLTVPATLGKFEPLSADAHSLDGLNVSLAIVDELHAHKTRAVWDVLDTATGARSQPLLAAITTAGVDVGGICYEKLTYLHKVLEGTLEDETFFGIEYTIDEGDDWRLPETHQKANPNWGVSVMPDDLARKVKAATQSPSATNNFLTKHLNVWVRAAASWMPMDRWIALGDPALRVEQFAGAPCWIGVDLAEVQDIAALVAIFRPDPQRYVWIGRYYLPKKTVERSPIAQMSGWVQKGHIIQTDGDQADFGRIENDIMAWCDQLKVREIDFDRALAAHMSQNLKKRLEPRMGRDAVDAFVVTVPQTVETMNPAMQFVERMTLAGDIVHDGNPANNWMFSNVVVERNHKDEIYPRKAGGKDSPNKIDGPVAGLTAISRALLASVDPPRPRGVPKIWTPSGFKPLYEDGAGESTHA